MKSVFCGNILSNADSNDEKIELTKHLLKAVEYVQAYVKTNDSNDWKKFADAERGLAKKYRSRLMPYTNLQFHKYFDFRLIFAHKDILTQEQFNSMKSAAEQSLSEEEIDMFLADAKHLLSTSIYFLYLSDTGKAEPATEPTVTLNDTDSVTDEQNKDITKARQLLAIYYFLKASLGIEARDSNSASAVAAYRHIPCIRPPIAISIMQML